MTAVGETLLALQQWAVANVRVVLGGAGQSQSKGSTS